MRPFRNILLWLCVVTSSSVVWSGCVWYRLVVCGVVDLCVVSSGCVWSRLVVWSRPVVCGLVWLCVVSFGCVWSRPVVCGIVRLCVVASGCVWSRPVVWGMFSFLHSHSPSPFLFGRRRHVILTHFPSTSAKKNKNRLFYYSTQTFPVTRLMFANLRDFMEILPNVSKCL